MLVGDRAGRGEVALGGYDDAGLALDRLEQDRGGLVGDRGGERVGVAVRDEGDVARAAARTAPGRPPCEVSASAPIVRPWKPPSATTTWVRPVRRVSLNAASLASVPELVKKTLPSAGALPSSPSSFSASSTWGSLVKKLEMCPSVPSWLVTASTSAGWAWPSALTAMPPRRSTYSLPSASQTWAPCAAGRARAWAGRRCSSGRRRTAPA